MATPLLVTVGIIIKKEKLLIMRRARAPYENRWCFIGGCGAFDEESAPEAAVKVEVREDIGCRYEPEFLMMNYAEGEKPTLSLFYIGEINGNPVCNPKYVSELTWEHVDELKRVNLGFDHELTIPKIKEWIKMRSNL